MKKNSSVLIIISTLTILVAAFKTTNAENTNRDTRNTEEKSVAWYVANAKEARDQNKECHDNPVIQSTPNCLNSLQALQLSFAGGPGRR